MQVSGGNCITKTSIDKGLEFFVNIFIYFDLFKAVWATGFISL